jgi:hypothetical protein
MPTRIIVGIMLLGFTGTLLVHWRDVAEWCRPGASHTLSHAWALPVRASAPSGSWRSAVAAVDPLQRANAAPPAAESAAAPAIEVPPPGAADAPPLPVMFAIRNEGDAELDLVNTSDDALTITVLVADAAKAQVFMPPRVEQHLGTESGIELEPGSNVTLRSAGYQELTQTVR